MGIIASLSTCLFTPRDMGPRPIQALRRRFLTISDPTCVAKTLSVYSDAICDSVVLVSDIVEHNW